jgi:hypothetical protein
MIDAFEGIGNMFRRTYRCPVCGMPTSLSRLDQVGLCKVCQDAEYLKEVEICLKNLK